MDTSDERLINPSRRRCAFTGQAIQLGREASRNSNLRVGQFARHFLLPRHSWLLVVIIGLIVFSGVCSRAFASGQDNWNVTNGNWSVSSNWSPAGPPGPTLDAVFNPAALTAITVSLDVPGSVAGLVFKTSGTNLVSSSTSTQSLSIGSDGISLNLAGAVIGTAANPISIDLIGSQTWTDTSATSSVNFTPPYQPLQVGANVSLDPSITTASTLTLAGSGVGQNLVSGNISDGANASLGIKATGGIWILAGSNTFTGSTIISGSGTVLSITNDSSSTGPGSAGSLGAVPAAPTNDITINGGTLQASATLTLNSNRGIVLGPATGNGGGTIDVTPGNVLTYGAPIANDNTASGATDSLTVVDSGTLVLTGTNTYTGGTTVSSGGNLAVDPTAPTANALGSGAITLSGGRLSLGTATAQTNALNVTGPSVIDVSGTATAEISAPVAISNNSSLQVTGGSTGPNTAYNLSLGVGSSVAVSGNATFDVSNNGNGAGSLTLGPLNISGSAPTLSFVGPGTITLTGPTTGLAAGAQIIVGPGTTSSVPGVAPLDEWNFEEGSGSTLFDTGTLHNNATLVNNQLASPPVFANYSTVGHSALNLGSSLPTGSPSNGAIVQVPYTNGYSATSFTISEWVNFSGAGLSENDNLLNDVPTNAPQTTQEFSTNFLIYPLGKEIIYSIGTGSSFLTENGLASFGSFAAGRWNLLTIALGPNGGEIYLNGGTAAGGSQVSLSYTGTPLLASPNTFLEFGYFAGNLDDVQIYNQQLSAAQVAQLYATSGGSTLNSNNATALGTASQLTIAPGSAVNLGASQTVSALTGAGSATLNGNTFTLGSTDNLSFVSGVSISDGTSSGSIVKAGAGGTALFGASSYSGGTTVGSGTLSLGMASSPAGSGAITLTGGRLSLAGQQSGGVTNAGLLMQIYAGASRTFSTLSQTTAYFNSLTPAITTQTTAGGITSLNWPYVAIENEFSAQGYSGSGTSGVPGAFLSGDLYIVQPGWYQFGSTGNGSVFIDGNAASSSAGLTQYLTSGIHAFDVGWVQPSTNAFEITYSGPDTGGNSVAIPNNVLFTSSASTLNSSQTYGNNVTVATNSSIDVSGSLAATLGDLSIGGNTLSVTSSDNSGNPYSLMFSGPSGVTALGGNATFKIMPSFGGGTGTLNLGALNDGGTPRITSFAGFGNVNLNSPAASIVAGTEIVVGNSSVEYGPVGGLASEYQFGEGSGTTAGDSGPNSIAGTLVGSGVSYVGGGKTGPFALKFTSANSYVQIPASIADQITGSFTISAWVNPTTQDTDGTIFSTNNNLSTAGGVALQVSQTAITAQVGDFVQEFEFPQLSQRAIPGNWSLITLSVSATSSTLYLNDGTSTTGGGSAKVTGSGASPNLEFSTEFATIGNMQNGTSSFSSANQFFGEIDDVRIYDTALTAAQVAQLYSLTPVGVTLNSGTSTSIGSGSQLTVNTGSTFDLGASQQVASLAGAGNVTLGPNTLTIGTGAADNSSSIFSGAITGTGGLTLNKSASGGLALAGALYSYTGPTLLNSGTLALTTAAASITVANGNFASPVLSAGAFGFEPASSATWTFINGKSGIATVNTSIGPTNSNPNTSDTQFGYINNLGTAFQSTALQPGIYSISFYAEGISKTAVNPFSFWVIPGTNNSNTTTSGSIDAINVTPAQSTWNLYTGNFVIPSAGNYTLDFVGANESSISEISFLDDVALQGNFGAIGNTPITVASGATFAPQPLGGVVTAGAPATGSATLNLQAGSTFTMVDGAIGTFLLQQATSFGSGNAALTLGGATLDLELGSAGADKLAVSAASASVSGTNTINVTPIGTSLTPGSYNLITAAGGLNTGGTFQLADGLPTEVISMGTHTYTLALNNSSTAESVSVTNGASGGGGPSAVGGSGASFDDITTPGAFSSSFNEPASAAALATLIGSQATGEINFALAGSPIELWQLQFTGVFTDGATVTLHFDPSAIGSTPLADLEIEHYEDGQWVAPPDQMVNLSADTITFETDGFSPFVLAVVPEPSSVVLAVLGSVLLALVGRLRCNTSRYSRKNRWFRPT